MPGSGVGGGLTWYLPGLSAGVTILNRLQNETKSSLIVAQVDTLGNQPGKWPQQTEGLPHGPRYSVWFGAEPWTAGDSGNVIKVRREMTRTR